MILERKTDGFCAETVKKGFEMRSLVIIVTTLLSVAVALSEPTATPTRSWSEAIRDFLDIPLTATPTPTLMPDWSDCVMLLDYRDEELPSTIRIRTASECVDVIVTPGEPVRMEAEGE